MPAELISEEDGDRLIDSAPIPACTYGRASQCQTAIGEEYFSVMPSRKAKLFGFRVQVLATFDQVIDRWMLAPAAPRDSRMAAAFLEDAAHLRIWGDNAYHDPTIQTWLKEVRNIDSSIMLLGGYQERIARNSFLHAQPNAPSFEIEADDSDLHHVAY